MARVGLKTTKKIHFKTNMGGVFSTLTSNFNWKMGVAAAAVIASIKIYQNQSEAKPADSPDAAPAAAAPTLKAAAPPGDLCTHIITRELRGAHPPRCKLQQHLRIRTWHHGTKHHARDHTQKSTYLVAKHTTPPKYHVHGTKYHVHGQLDLC